MRMFNRLADGLLARAVPQLTAAAQTCWNRKVCTRRSCSAPYVMWAENYRCCRVGSGGASCAFRGSTCNCYVG